VKGVLGAGLTIGVALAAGCNTIAGIGQDVRALGPSVGNAAKDMQNKL
jgi:predicted small secreted protein